MFLEVEAKVYGISPCVIDRDMVTLNVMTRTPSDHASERVKGFAPRSCFLSDPSLFNQFKSEDFPVFLKLKLTGNTKFPDFLYVESVEKFDPRQLAAKAS